MSTASRRPLPLLALFAVALLFLSPGNVRSEEDPLADAVVALTKGEVEAARTALIDVIESDTLTPSDLAHAAEISLQLKNKDLFERVRAAGERFEAAERKDVLVDLSLGLAYLGLAEHNIRTRTGGSGTALLLEDAKARAETVLKEASHPTARRLGALAAYTAGDLETAIARLEADKAEVDAYNKLLLGGWLYERALVRSGKGDAKAARLDLERAASLLAGAIGTFDAGEGTLVHPDVVAEGRLRTAWTHHRLGAFAPARAAYLDAHRLGGRTAQLARRGLQSLYANDPAALVEAFEAAVAGRAGDAAPLDALVALLVGQQKSKAALDALRRRLVAHPQDPAGFDLGGRVHAKLGNLAEAEKHFVHALGLDAGFDRAAYGLQVLAQRLASTDMDRAVAIYENVLRIRPKDPFARNNYGFLLRERVSPHTTMGPGNVQTLKPDAPEAIRKALVRCRDVYAEAVALIPEAEDESRDLKESWNLAGIVNDYGLMLHYFADIQDAALAERMYLRALRMTEDSFKDTYSPNLRRLYTHVLPDRELSWYRIAVRAKDAILIEKRTEAGLELVPDARKREAAAADALRLRARIVQELGRDAAEDDAPWPIEAGGGSGR